MEELIIDTKKKLKVCKGITLITLVITIIILLILAGVAINLSLGENGIFKRAKQAKEQYEISSLKEKLELVLLDAATEKEVNKDYNKEEFLDNMLEEEGMLVNGSFVTVDNHIFLIDRDKLVILENLGQTNIKISKQVKSYKGKNSNNKYEVEALIKVESNLELKSVKIQNPDGTIIQMTTEELETGKNVVLQLDEEYIIIVTNIEGKEETRKIIEKSEEIIRTAEELAEFRDKVNSGLTYEGKTIKLGNDIDLSSVCGENVNGQEINWKPIGSSNLVGKEFKGIFNGQYKSIKNLYININDINVNKYEKENYFEECTNFGLFGFNSGKIQNVIMENVYIYIDISNYSKASSYSSTVGALTGINIGEIENIGIKSGNITSINTSKSNIGQRGQQVGGIAGGSFGEMTKIYNSYNNINISVTDSNYYDSNANTIIYVGGITGHELNGIIKNCYNSGNIECNNSYVSCAGGILACLNISTIENCYNYGRIYGVGSNGQNDYKMGISAFNNSGKTTNSYCTKTSATYSYFENGSGMKTVGMVEEDELKTYASILNGNVTEDEKIWLDDISKINNGYPILKWQIPEYRK